jgi:chromosome segregation ATPase
MFKKNESKLQEEYDSLKAWHGNLHRNLRHRDKRLERYQEFLREMQTEISQVLSEERGLSYRGYFVDEICDLENEVRRLKDENRLLQERIELLENELENQDETRPNS